MGGGYRRNVKEKREECEGKALEVREERIIKWGGVGGGRGGEDGGRGIWEGEGEGSNLCSLLRCPEALWLPSPGELSWFRLSQLVSRSKEVRVSIPHQCKVGLYLFLNS